MATETLAPDSIDSGFKTASCLKRADLLRLAEPPNLSLLSVQIHRNYAFELIGSVLPPFLWLSRLKPLIHYGDYDDTLTFAQVESDALQIVSLDFERYGAKVTSIEFMDWLGGRLERLRSRTERPVLVSNWPSENPDAQRLNVALEEMVGRLPGIFVWDTAEVFQTMPADFFDARAAGAKGTRLSNRACVELARDLGLIRLPSVLLTRIRAVAMDLDNTLYSGVLAEDGIDGIRIDEKHTAIYRQLLRLREDGVFLAVLSKNEERDFVELCQRRPDFLIKREHLSSASVGWHAKAEGLERIARDLHIGVDSILVIDDDPGEVAQLRAAYPTTPLVYSPDAEQTHFWLRHFPALNGYRPNEATKLRIRDLEASSERNILRASMQRDDYLRELKLELTYGLNPTKLCRRLCELSQKTNQFNTGLRRFSETEVARRLEQPGYFAISVGMRDRFCDSGVIGAIFARSEGRQLIVEEIAVSCRALGRNVESPMIALALAPLMEAQGLCEVAFCFHEGPRNSPARAWLSGFTGVADIVTESFTEVSWQAIPQRTEYLNAPVTSRWETIAE